MAPRKKPDPKKGTGKKPKGSGAKVKKINKPYARKIQILTVGEQRAKVMGKTEVASIFKKAKKTLKQKKEKKDGKQNSRSA